MELVTDILEKTRTTSRIVEKIFVGKKGGHVSKPHYGQKIYHLGSN